MLLLTQSGLLLMCSSSSYEEVLSFPMAPLMSSPHLQLSHVFYAFEHPLALKVFCSRTVDAWWSQEG